MYHMNTVNRFDAMGQATWPRLRALLDPIQPGGDVINMTIGDPQHPFPEWVSDILMQEMQGFNSYPNNNGSPELLQAISDWIKRRYDADADPETKIMIANGTREALYNAEMALLPGGSTVLVPNPFYPVYAVGALSIGAIPVYLNCTHNTGYLPDLEGLSAETLNATSAMFICSPSNPQGAVASMDYWQRAIALAEEYDFKIFADECYTEIYRSTPPVGALEAAQKMGADPERVVVFHSLSKRSNLPGLRSGFVASGPENIKRIKQLRAFAGAPVPAPIQAVSAKIWADDSHVVANRQLYCDKFEAADHIFAGVDGYKSPEAGFFLWLPVPDGEAAAVELWSKTGVRVLPGSFLGQTADEQNPGQRYIRVALVAPKEETQRGLCIIRDCLYD